MSRVIKSQWAVPSLDEQKVISIKKLQSLVLEDGHSNPQHDTAILSDILSRAKADADIIVKEAQLQAQSILNQISFEKESWVQEKIGLMEEARKEGYSKGILEGKEQGYNECRNLILYAQEVVNSSKKDYQQHIASAEKTILQIGMKAAEKIIGKKLENEDAFLSIVKNALKEAREYQEVKLLINPCHYEFLLSRKEELTTIFPNENDIYIYPDDELSETACLIESANGRIDAAVDSQLEEIKRKLLELLESGPS